MFLLPAGGAFHNRVLAGIARRPSPFPDVARWGVDANATTVDIVPANRITGPRTAAFVTLLWSARKVRVSGKAAKVRGTRSA